MCRARALRAATPPFFFASLLFCVPSNGETTLAGSGRVGRPARAEPTLVLGVAALVAVHSRALTAFAAALALVGLAAAANRP